MKKKLQITGIIAITSIVFSLVISACGSAAPATPTTDPGAVYTMAAATVQAQLTQAALANPTAVPPTNTPEPSPTTPPIPTAEPTQAVAVQPTAPFAGAGIATALPTVANNLNPGLQPTRAAGAVEGFQVGDYAKFQYNVPGDGTLFYPGIHFMGEVGFLNSGSITWTTDYKLVYTGGAQFSGVTSVPLSKATKPGEKAIFNIAFTAPGEINDVSNPWYLSYWKLVNQTGLPVINGDMYWKIKVVKE
jgi:hypothetical protein